MKISSFMSHCKSALLLVVIIAAVGFMGVVFSAHSPIVAVAQTTDTTLTGWAWSSNIGWIKLSDSNFGVVLKANGLLEGYAWSNSIGWIQFGNGLAGYPAGGVPAQVNLSTGQVTGYARAINAGVADGWNGWISLSGTTYPSEAGCSDWSACSKGVFYDKTKTQNNLNGNAWSSDLGWIRFNSTASVASVPSLSASCSRVVTTNTDNVSVVYSAGYSNNNGSVSYKWDGVAGNQTLSKQYTRNSAAYTVDGPALTVSDSSSSVNPTCASVTVPAKDTTTSVKNLKLYIGPTAISTLKSHRISLGESFYLNWINDYADNKDFECIRKGPYNEGWGNSPKNAKLYTSPAVGTFTFQIECTNTKNLAEKSSDSVTLKVVDTTGGEF